MCPRAVSGVFAVQDVLGEGNNRLACSASDDARSAQSLSWDQGHDRHSTLSDRTGLAEY